MNDQLPITGAQTYSVATINGKTIAVVPLEVAEKLERENISLRAWKESALAVEREWDQQVIAKLLGAKLGQSCRKVIAEKVPVIVADKARLDWLQDNACEEGRTMAMPRYSFHVKQWEGLPGRNVRAAIDAAMKGIQ